MRKPSLQQVFWHSFFFLRSFLHFFPHFFMEFFLHFVFFILHVSSSLRLRQLTLGSGGDGGADGGAEGGSGSHKPHKWGTLGHPGENDVRKIVPRQPRAIPRIRYSSQVK